MLMSRTDARLEIALTDGPRVTVDLANVASVALSARRTAGASVGLELIIQHIDGSCAATLSGALDMLAIVHQRIIEALAEVPARSVSADCAQCTIIDWLAA